MRGDRLALMLEGKGRATNLKQSNPQYDCTFLRTYSVEMTGPDENIECDKISEVDMSVEASNCMETDLVNINRTIEDEGGKKKITIEVQAEEELKYFHYYEYIPKCVTSRIIEFFEEGNPNPYQFTMDGSGNIQADPNTVVFTDPVNNIELVIKEPDPLMVWHFTGSNIEMEKFSYYLSDLQERMTSECLDQFRGGITETRTEVDASADTADFDQSTCNSIPGVFVGQVTPLEFEVGTSRNCCEDDSGETTNWFRSSGPGMIAVSPTPYACCNSDTDCVDKDGNCMESGTMMDSDGDADQDRCDNQVWYDT